MNEPEQEREKVQAGIASKLDVRDVERIYRVPRTKIFADIGTGKLPTAKIGKKRLADPSDAENWFQNYKAETALRDEARRRAKEEATRKEPTAPVAA